MAIYHLHMSNVSRAKGSNACATLSYITGQRVTCERTGETFDYGRKERIVACGTMLPDGAPIEWQDPHVLFNAIEQKETRKDARTAKKIELALAREWTPEQQESHLREYIAENITSRGYACTYAIHTDKDDNNPHAHILVPNRPIKNGKWASKQSSRFALDKDGNKIPVIDKKTGKQKVGKQNRKCWKREKIDNNPLENKETLQSLRDSWAELANKYLDKGSQISSKSLKAQGSVYIPTIHEGYRARALERQGLVSERCQYNRDVIERNIAITELLIAKAKQAQAEKQAEQARDQRKTEFAPYPKAERRDYSLPKELNKYTTATYHGRLTRRALKNARNNAQAILDALQIVRENKVNSADELLNLNNEANKKIAQLENIYKQTSEELTRLYTIVFAIKDANDPENNRDQRRENKRFLRENKVSTRDLNKYESQTNELSAELKSIEKEINTLYKANEERENAYMIVTEARELQDPFVKQRETGFGNGVPAKRKRGYVQSKPLVERSFIEQEQREAERAHSTQVSNLQTIKKGLERLENERSKAPKKASQEYAKNASAPIARTSQKPRLDPATLAKNATERANNQNKIHKEIQAKQRKRR